MNIERVPEQPRAPYGLRQVGTRIPQGTEQRQGPGVAGESRVIDRAHTSPLSRIISREMTRLRDEESARVKSPLTLDRFERVSGKAESPLPDSVIDTIYARMTGALPPE